jgi:uncharacterized protein YcbK (DUF882 family)
MRGERNRRFCGKPANDPTHAPQSLGRRELIRAGMFAALGVTLGRNVFLDDAAAEQQSARSLSLRNLHTGESVDAVYWANGRYIGAGLRKIDYILRDFRDNRIKSIDLSLLDLMFRIRQALDRAAPFDVISGYRSPKTNAMLAARGPGVSAHSMHMKGKAVDLRLAGCALETLWRTALAQSTGGVGYYSDSGFVHLDLGGVRRWVFPLGAG